MAQNETGVESQKSEHVLACAIARRARHVRRSRASPKGAARRWSTKSRACKRDLLRGRHALKTYVCVRKSSSNAMGRLAWAESVRLRI